MTNSRDIQKCDGVNRNAVPLARPTHLSLKQRSLFYNPSLPATPEHDVFYEGEFGITQNEVMKWGILTSSVLTSSVLTSPVLSSSDFNLSKSGYDTDSMKKVSRQIKAHSEGSEDKNGCVADEKDGNAFGKVGDPAKRNSQCCGQWVRAYLRKFWIKAPSDQKKPPGILVLPRQLTILERECLQNTRSPRSLKRNFLRKRHNATSQSLYSFYVEVGM